MAIPEVANKILIKRCIFIHEETCRNYSVNPHRNYEQRRILKELLMGYTKISLMGKDWLWNWSSFPRPLVFPRWIQLAAR